MLLPPSFGGITTLRCIPSEMIQVKVVRAGTQIEVPLAGRIQVTYRPDAKCNDAETDKRQHLDSHNAGMGVRPNHHLRVYNESLRLAFLPSRQGADALFPGDEVGETLANRSFSPFTPQPFAMARLR
jgi:hypothetical protein